MIAVRGFNQVAQQPQQINAPADLNHVHARVARAFFQNHVWANLQEQIAYLQVAATVNWGADGPQHLGLRNQYQQQLQAAQTALQHQN